ncbi:serine/threonine-protein kinase [Zavarzinella formosa]|uniref:serine/threonine-protein kinase n=1 Tax=Zavarzinella formosa TaxID=360055 RepID=UPI00031EC27F|nr:serine/threonine-protein kinase [Zavarzinella formosa]
MAEKSDPTLPNPRTPAGEDLIPEDVSGRALGDFELIRRIGVGGMGSVYLARQKSLKRQVAIKILRAELAANVTALRRFQAEAEAIASITHANIVQVYAIGEKDGLHYMALEYVEGRNLRDFFEKKGIPELPVALEIMRQVAAALDRAGELGFVHRDIKPENILLSKKGEIKVTDFGLSRCFAGDAAVNLTASGVTMGTPLYMSPEQVRGQAVDPRSDIYSFGVSCYHMLTGEPPFKGATAFDVALQHVQNDPRPLSALRPDLPADLVGLVHKMMAKRPEDRHQSAREVLSDLAKFQGGQSLNLLGSGIIPGLLASTTANGPVSSQPTVYGPTMITQAIPAPPRWGRWLALAGLAVASVGLGATVHWAKSPAAPKVDPTAALADTDPPPVLLRERELRKLINDRTVKVEVATDALIEMAMIFLREHRYDEATKLFEPDALRKHGAFEIGVREPARYKDQFHIMSIAGKAIVLAWQDQPDASNEEFLKLVREYPPVLKFEKPDPKLKPNINRGQLEAFFVRNTSGPAWRKAVNEALDRNLKNSGGKMPETLNRLRFIPAKGLMPKG